ncbi:MAG: zinc-dependent dehydrogenase [Candidatus Omnitrophica bacterium]|nr:zinc-dependent dehydrogenase [Candidatus Omnitrophota bacterium]MCM8790738.1 zinc-dependent dehydrogenase [Candidatus Omnitrophota bacterium]
MRVAMYYSNNDIRIQEMAKPEIGDSEMLVRVEASGICGSDVMEWYRSHKVPLVLGHEIAATVVATGKRVRSYKAGDRVVVAHHVPCGECRYCRDGHETTCDTLRATNYDPGGFSEFVRVPKINVEKGIFLIPRSVSFEEATFVEPLACVLRGQRLANLKKGKTVLVVGSGISGILHIKLAKSNGARRIIATDISEFRLEMARKAGAEHAIHADSYKPQNLKELNDGYLADLVIICAGAQSAFEQGLRSVERGGTVLIFTAATKDAMMPVPINDIFWRNEVTVTSSYGGSPQDHIEAMEKIRSRKVSVYDMITHRLPLAETGRGFRLVAEAKDSMKVIIEPQK